MLKNTVLTYGTFDLFHYGHLNLLLRARQLGAKLLVGVSSDEFNAKKGKRCIATYEEREAIVSALSLVDGVFPETCWEQKASDIVDNDVATLVMGDDWKGKFDQFGTLCTVVYLSRTPLISTTSRRQDIAEAQQQ